MPVKSVDVRKLGMESEGGGQRLLNGPHFQMWFNSYPPGRKGRMHCHNCDETLYVIEGELTVTRPDGERDVLAPGMAIMITGGQFYTLENSAPGKTVFLGHNPRPTETMRTVEYEPRQEHDPREGHSSPPRFTTLLS